MYYSIFTLLLVVDLSVEKIPLVINTWAFDKAAIGAWKVLQLGESNEKDVTVEALAAGCAVCENGYCDRTVGFGGSPDENGETTQDSMIFDGDTMNMGGIGCARNIKHAVYVAKHVLENTKHSLLVGNLATDFAKRFGFVEEELFTDESVNEWKQWKQNNCQPNFWKDVEPNSEESCGPYQISSHPIADQLSKNVSENSGEYNSENHDTIGMIVINGKGHVVAGTTTNGAKFKIPGRVGDSPLPGAGAYANSEVGAAVSTGDGDVMMRFLPSFLAVELLKDGVSPTEAANVAVARIAEKYKHFFGAVVVADKYGNFGAACNGMDKFPYAVANEKYPRGTIKYITNCTNYS